MFKPVDTDAVFNRVNAQHTAPVVKGPPPVVTAVQTNVTQNGNASEAEKIRAMGDKLSKIWLDK